MKTFNIDEFKKMKLELDENLNTTISKLNIDGSITGMMVFRVLRKIFNASTRTLSYTKTKNIFDDFGIKSDSKKRKNMKAIIKRGYLTKLADVVDDRKKLVALTKESEKIILKHYKKENSILEKYYNKT